LGKVFTLDSKRTAARGLKSVSFEDEFDGGIRLDRLKPKPNADFSVLRFEDRFEETTPKQ
jgi:hypothetical protein